MKVYFSKEVLIGIITIVSLFILYFGVNYLKGVNLFKPTNHYYVKFENVTDLQKSSPVYVDGFKVGIVNEIHYDYENPGNIIVSISLDKSMKVQEGSYVEINSSLTTGASLHIILNKYVSTYYHVGDTLEGKMKTGMMDVVSQEVLPQIQNVIPKIDSILIGLQTIVNHPAFTQSLNHIQNTTYNLSKTTESLSRVMSNQVPSILDNFANVTADLNSLSTQFTTLDIEKTYASINNTLDNLENFSNQFNNPESNLSLLLNDRALYDNLNNVSENASDLIIDFKANPRKYIKFSLF